MDHQFVRTELPLLPRVVESKVTDWLTSRTVDPQRRPWRVSSSRDLNIRALLCVCPPSRSVSAGAGSSRRGGGDGGKSCGAGQLRVRCGLQRCPHAQVGYHNWSRSWSSPGTENWMNVFMGLNNRSRVYSVQLPFDNLKSKSCMVEKSKCPLHEIAAVKAIMYNIHAQQCSLTPSLWCLGPETIAVFLKHMPRWHLSLRTCPKRQQLSSPSSHTRKYESDVPSLLLALRAWKSHHCSAAPI